MRGVVGWDVRDGSWRSAGQRSCGRRVNGQFGCSPPEGVEETYRVGRASLAAGATIVSVIAGDNALFPTGNVIHRRIQ